MSDRKTIDPRIKLTLLPIASFTSFFISDTILIFGLIVFAFFLYLYSGMWKRALCFILFFVLLYCIEFGLGKFPEASIVFAIYMFIYFASRMTVAVKKSRHKKCFSFFSFFKSGHWPHF